jgi:hypothetical protein
MEPDLKKKRGVTLSATTKINTLSFTADQVITDD